MHFSQYLFLTNKVVVGRKNDNKDALVKVKILNLFYFNYNYLWVIMGSLSMFGKYDEQILKNLIIIPINWSDFTFLFRLSTMEI